MGEEGRLHLGGAQPGLPQLDDLLGAAKDAEVPLLIAADGYYLRGRFAPTQAAVEAALSGLDLPVLWHRRGTTEFLERAMEGKPQEALPVPS
ncbi:hypothetical protein, partial [Thermus scotoductus]|uniref:hypothetical protein n=1 Tax=Thermus scotoductus TaxID=37636 RepID=UPI001290C424